MRELKWSLKLQEDMIRTAPQTVQQCVFPANSRALHYGAKMTQTEHILLVEDCNVFYWLCISDMFQVMACDVQCWGLLLKKVIHYILNITLKNSNALDYLITPWRKKLGTLLVTLLITLGLGFLVRIRLAVPCYWYFAVYLLKRR